MDLEVNADLPGVDAEGQESPQVVEIDDPNIPQDPHPIELETYTEAEC